MTISGCVWGCEDVQEEEGSGRGWGVYTEGCEGKEVIRVTISGRAGVCEDLYEEGSDRWDRQSSKWSSVGNWKVLRGRGVCVGGEYWRSKREDRSCGQAQEQ